MHYFLAIIIGFIGSNTLIDQMLYTTKVDKAKIAGGVQGLANKDQAPPDPVEQILRSPVFNPPRYCVTEFHRYGPSPTFAAPVGSLCWIDTPSGRIYGRIE